MKWLQVPTSIWNTYFKKFNVQKNEVTKFPVSPFKLNKLDQKSRPHFHSSKIVTDNNIIFGTWATIGVWAARLGVPFSYDFSSFLYNLNLVHSCYLYYIYFILQKFTFTTSSFFFLLSSFWSTYFFWFPHWYPPNPVPSHGIEHLCICRCDYRLNSI